MRADFVKILSAKFFLDLQIFFNKFYILRAGGVMEVTYARYVRGSGRVKEVRDLTYVRYVMLENDKQ